MKDVDVKIEREESSVRDLTCPISIALWSYKAMHTSKQYPNSNWSFSPGCTNRPWAAPLLRPREPLNPTSDAAGPSGPNSRPMVKYAIVDIKSDEPMK